MTQQNTYKCSEWHERMTMTMKCNIRPSGAPLRLPVLRHQPATGAQQALNLATEIQENLAGSLENAMRQRSWKSQKVVGISGGSFFKDERRNKKKRESRRRAAREHPSPETKPSYRPIVSRTFFLFFHAALPRPSSPRTSPSLPSFRKFRVLVSGAPPIDDARRYTWPPVVAPVLPPPQTTSFYRPHGEHLSHNRSLNAAISIHHIRCPLISRKTPITSFPRREQTSQIPFRVEINQSRTEPRHALIKRSSQQKNKNERIPPPPAKKTSLPTHGEWGSVDVPR